MTCTPTPISSPRCAVTTFRSPTRPTGTSPDPSTRYVPLPVPAALLRELYVDIGLSIHHIALLIGLGDFATRNRLIQAGVTFRPSQERCPWNRRRYTD